MKVVISGSSGLIGQALYRYLSANGHEVGCLQRNNSAQDYPHWDPGKGLIDFGSFSNADVVIHLAGESIAAGRWTTEKKYRISNSRIKGTELISEYLVALPHKPKVFISGSAIGIYGDRGDELVDEDSRLGDGFLADICKRWEEATIPAAEADIRVVNIRTGMVLSSSGGALKKMVFPFQMGLGGVIGNGKQYMSWISANDVVESIHYLMKNDSIHGAVNLVSPYPVRNYEFVKTLGRILHRPTIIPAPAWALRLILGEMANELVLASTRVTPNKLLSVGYKFQHSKLDEALQYVLI